jgi:hypothetical protein
MRLGYDDGLKDMDAAARQKSLQQERSIFASEQTPEPGLRLPALPFATPCKASRPAARKEEGRPDILHLDWGLVRGNWKLSLHAEQMDSERDSALQQLPQLWQAMQWPKAPELPPELPRQEREVSHAWRVDDDWPRAGQLARAALADAQFPAELARLNTVAGISAFKAGQQAEAGRYLDQALQAWPYVSLFRLESELVDLAQQYGAELAAQQGRDADAARLMRQYLRNAGGLQNIWVQASDPQVADLENRRTGMVLPMRAAAFICRSQGFAAHDVPRSDDRAATGPDHGAEDPRVRRSAGKAAAHRAGKAVPLEGGELEEAQLHCADALQGPPA